MNSERSRIYRTEAIVLSRLDLGESDRIYTMLSRHHGKIRMVGKGVRKPGSKLGSGLEIFAHVSLILAKGRELDIITSVESLGRRSALQNDLERYSYASHAAELCLAVAQEGQESEALFALLIQSLEALDRGDDRALVNRHFELALLTIAGFRLDPYRCMMCGNCLEERVNFVGRAQDGLLCPSCAKDARVTREVSVNAQKVIRLIDRDGYDAAVGLQLDNRVGAEVDSLLGECVRSMVERDLSSLRVLREIRESSPAFATGG